MELMLQTELEKNLPFWNKIGKETKESLINSSKIVKYEQGKVMHAGKDECTGLFLILSGRVRAFIVTEEGKEMTLFRLLDRDLCIFSATCMLKNISFDIYVSTETDVEAILIPAKKYKEITDKDIVVANFTNDVLSSRMSDIMTVLEQSMFYSMDRRIAMFLEEQSALERKDVLQITHEQIANHLGSAREVISRRLKFLAEEGVIRIGRGYVEIVDHERLMEI